MKKLVLSLWQARSPRRFAAWTLVVVSLVYLSTLGLGFFTDDYIFLARLSDAQVHPVDPWNLYSFVGEPRQEQIPLGRSAVATASELIDLGAIPWFSHEQLQLKFFRPLSSCLMWMDWKIFAEQASFWHLHSVLWLVGFLFIAAWCYRLLLPRSLALLAWVVLAVSGKFVLPVAWLSNRNILVAAVPALIAYGLHVYARERSQRWAICLAPVFAALSLLGAEAALGVIAYIVAYELMAARGSWSRRAIYLLPYFILGVVYIGVYKFGGFGAAHSDMYLDPRKDFLLFISQALPHLGILLMSLVTAVPAEISLWTGSGSWLHAGLGFLSATGVWVVYRHIETRVLDRHVARLLRSLGLGMLLAMLPALATLPMDRVLVGPLFGAAAILAACIGYGVQSMVVWVRRSAYALTLSALILSPLAGLGTLAALFGQAARAREAIASLQVSDAIQSVIVVNAPDNIIPMYTMLMRRFSHLSHPPLQALSFVRAKHRVTRLDDTSIELAIDRGSRPASGFEGLFRASRDALQAGQKIQSKFFTAEILEVQNQLLQRVRFYFPEGLDHPSLSFQQWLDGRLQPLLLPKIGSSLELHWEQGPLGI